MPDISPNQNLLTVDPDSISIAKKWLRQSRNHSFTLALLAETANWAESGKIQLLPRPVILKQFSYGLKISGLLGPRWS